MVTHNISDLNTGTGKIKCAARNTKQTLNGKYIEENLKKVIGDNAIIEKAMNNILNNREVKTTYKLQVAKKLSLLKKNIINILLKNDRE